MRNVIIFYPGFAHRGGGVMRHVDHFRQSLDKMGIGNKLFSLDNAPVPFCFMPRLLRIVINLVFPPWGAWAQEALVTRMFQGWYYWKRNGRSYDGVVFESIYAAFKTKQPSLIMLHALLSDNVQDDVKSGQSLSLFRKKEKQIFIKQYEHHEIITVSERYKQWIVESLDLPQNISLNVVNLGIDTEPFRIFPPKRKGNDSGPVRLLACPGFFNARKNTCFLLELVDYLLEKKIDFQLHLAGAGGQEQRLKSLVLEKKMSNCVKFLGRVQPNDIPKLMSTYHILLHPSLKESFSYTLLEAKFANLITLASKDLEIPDDFIDYPLDLRVEDWGKTIQKIIKTQQLTINNQIFFEKYNSNIMTTQILKKLDLEIVKSKHQDVPISS
ncbi:MAG: glycosyltransferase [SAR324 cluster bacterium]|nr:glycosyltransferase [SAR324 cluster bacterium]